MPGHERADEADDQTEVPPGLPDLGRLGHGAGEQLAGGAGNRVLDHAGDARRDAAVAERDRQAHEGDGGLHEQQADEERERSGMGEAVGEAHPLEGGAQAASGVRRCERLLGVVAGQLPRLRDRRRGAHDRSSPVSTGTQIRTAAGWTLIFSFLASPR